ncbi:uncharacterized protein LOC128672275 isoform X2 [Plodia interpunctella]|nr:uncharacterized protein LOC128672275 isoform X2 [Plodia interpunctella]
MPENKIQVIDNGCGITETDFDLLGKKYSTSKCVDLNTLKYVPHTYGYRGQFLANLIKIAQKIKITSRFEKGENTWKKIFYNGKERDLAKTTCRPSVGTTVEVSDLFYNLHIQSKCVDSLNELSDIKTLLKQLTLVHSNISISLRDDSKNEIIFKAHKNRNIYQTLGLLFNIDEKDIAEFKVEKKEYKVTAYFGKKDKDVGQHHWIYLNGKFLNNCKLHKIVNDILSKSCTHLSKRKTKSKVYEEEDIFTKMNLPFYIILLSCPYYDYDTNERSKQTTLEFKNWEDITNLLKKLIKFYCGDDILKKPLKLTPVETNYINAKDDDKRNQVRKIVEKLLKSNSKMLEVSQMLNGVKGKLTKRNKKKKKSLNISLSKVIPSKNKVNGNHKDKSKESAIDVVKLNLSRIQNTNRENEDNEDDKQVKEKHITNDEKSINVSKYNVENIKKYNIETTKMCIKEQRNSSKQYIISKKQNGKPKEKLKTFRNLKKLKRSRNNIPSVDGTFQRIDIHQNKNMKIKKDVNFHNKYNKNNIINFEEENLLNGNDFTTMYNIKSNNKQINIRKNVEEIKVYDYIPHPLNSTQHSEEHQIKFTKKPHTSSHDLVKTILSTQCNNVSTNENQSSFRHEESDAPKKSEISYEIAKDLTTSINIEYNRLMKQKNSRESTFDAWNFDVQSYSNYIDKVTEDELYISKMTYDSHHYNKNAVCENSHKTKTNKFMSRQSKDNFIVSVRKQETRKMCRNKFNHLPKINFQDVNVKFGIKNFFKNRNFLQEPSFIIEFSNTNKGDSHAASEQISKNIFRTYNKKNIFTNPNKYMKTYNPDEDFLKEYSTKIVSKNTYTLSDNYLNAREEYNMSCQNYEPIRSTENILQGTYTIETHNDKDFYYWKKYENNQYSRKEDQLNVIFVSEPQTEEIAQSSADDIIEPIHLCETILNKNDTPKPSSDMEIDLNEDIAEQWPMTKEDKHIETLKISQQEISHHFNYCVNSTNCSAAAQNIPLNTNAEINTRNSILVENNVTGTIILQDQHNDNLKATMEPINNNFNIKIRPRYMPKGMSQIFENSNTKGICDYKLEEEYYTCNIYEDFTKVVETNTEIFKPGVQHATGDASKAIEKVNLKLHKENSALIFDGKLLKQAQILNQVDNKFIAAVIKSKAESKDFLVVFDQHAVHERIRLENNLSDYFNQQEWKSVKLDSFVLKLNKDEILYLHNFKEKITQLGLEWNILNDYEVSVSSIPEAILGKNPRQEDKVVTAVKNLILEEINAIKTQGGCISLHPKSIMDLVFSEACRYAIKFGDKLTTNDCNELIQSLSECKTPFQCAHGRPVMAVLMEMTSRDVQEYKIDMAKIRSFFKTKRRQPVKNIN